MNVSARELVGIRTCNLRPCAKPHRKLFPCHVIATCIEGSFLIVGVHVMHGAGGPLRDWNPILLTKVVYITQPSRTVGLEGIVHPDVP